MLLRLLPPEGKLRKKRKNRVTYQSSYSISRRVVIGKDEKKLLVSDEYQKRV